MKIDEDIGHSYKSVLSWFGNSRAKDKRQQREDMRNEEQDAKNEDVIGEVRQEEIGKGQRDMSGLGNQPPGEPITVASQSELDESFTDLRALLDSDSD